MAMRGCRSDRANALPRPRGRRGGVPRAHRALPAGAPAALLPDPRLGSGRRGSTPGDVVGRLAWAWALRRAIVAAHLAAQDRDESVPERGAGQAPSPARGGGD